MLITEEMRRNITYCGYEGLRWRGLSVNQGGHVSSARRGGTSSNPSQPSTDAALQEGRSSYALERARDEELLSAILTAKWHPLYTEWKRHPLVGPLLIDPEFDNLLVTGIRLNGAPKDAASDVTEVAPQVIALDMSDGLALSTDDCESEPTCVYAYLLPCSLLNSTMLGGRCLRVLHLLLRAARHDLLRTNRHGLHSGPTSAALPTSTSPAPPGTTSSAALPGSTSSAAPPGTTSCAVPPGTASSTSSSAPPGTTSSAAPPGTTPRAVPPGTASSTSSSAAPSGTSSSAVPRGTTSSAVPRGTTSSTSGSGTKSTASATTDIAKLSAMPSAATGTLTSFPATSTATDSSDTPTRPSLAASQSPRTYRV
jgi:hypothetical protein